VTADLDGLSLGGSDGDNYQISGVTTPLEANISQRDLTITIGGATRIATPGSPFETDPSLTMPELQGDDTEEDITGTPVVFTSQNSTATTAGDYPSDLGVETNGDEVPNYNITQTLGTLTIVPAEPTTFVSIADPIQTTAGEILQGVDSGFVLTPPTVKVTDDYNNAVPNVSVSVSLESRVGSNGTIFSGNTTQTTNSNGEAVFNNLEIRKADPRYYLEYTSAGIAPLNSFEFGIIAAPASQMTIQVEPVSQTAGVTLTGNASATIQAQLTDPFGNPVIGTYNVRASITGNKTIFGTNPKATNPSGLVEFTDLSIQSAGNYTMTFTPLAAGLDSDTSSEFTISPDFASSNITVSLEPGTATAGVAIPGSTTGFPAVVIEDQYGNPIADYTVAASLNTVPGGSPTFDGGTLTVTTDANGSAVFNDLVINKAALGYTLGFEFTGTGLNKATTSSPFDVDHAAPAKVVIMTNPPAEPQAGVLFNPQPIVKLVDEFDNDATESGIAVTASLSSVPGAGTTLNGTTSLQTDAQGVVTYSDLQIDGLITAAPGRTITFESTGLTSATADVSLKSGPASTLAFVAQPPAEVMAAENFSATLKLTDQFSNPATGNGEMVQAAISVGDGTLGGNLTLEVDQSGEAIFNDLAINGVVGNRTLEFTSGSLQSQTANISVTPDLTTAAITINQQPTQSVAGTPLSGPPAIVVKDRFDNAIEGYVVTANLTLNSGVTPWNGGTASLTTEPDGTAVFDDLVKNTAASGYVLNFSFNETSGSITSEDSVDSDAFAIVGAAPSSITMVGQPVQTSAGRPVSPNPSVLVEDEFGNDLDTITVNATLLTGNFTLDSTRAATTAVNGVAAFNNLKIEKAQTYRIEFVVDGYPSVSTRSAEFAIVGATPSSLVMTQQPISGPAGVLINNGLTAPSVEARDIYNNLVANVSIKAVLNNGTFTSGTDTVNTGSNGASLGVASFGNLIINKADSYTITFTSQTAGNPKVVSDSFTINPNESNASIVVNTQPVQAVAGSPIPGTESGSPTVTIKDAYENPFIGKNVTVSLLTGNFMPGSVHSVLTDLNGVAVFDDLKVATSGTYRLSFAAPSIPGPTETDEFAVVAGAPSELHILTQPVAGPAGAVLETQPVIQVRDTLGNVVLADNATPVDVAIGSGSSGDLGGTLTLTATAGVASFTDLSLGGLVSETYTLAFSSAGLSGVSSNTLEVSPGTPANLEITNEPVQTIAGQILEGLDVGPVAVKITDAYTNPVDGIEVVATPNGFTFGAGSVDQVATSNLGIAGFGGLKVEQAGSFFTITFGANGTYQPTGESFTLSLSSAQFNVLAGAPATILLTQDASDVAINAVMNPAPAVQLVDDFNNPASGYTISADIPGGFAGASTSELVTDLHGNAVFSNLSVADPAAQTRITFSADAFGVDEVETSPFNVVDPSVITAIELAGSTDDLAVGDQRDFTATLKNGLGNSVSTTGSVEFSKSSGDGSVTGLGNVNAVDGVASITLQGAVAGSVSIIATAEGVESNDIAFVVTGTPEVEILSIVSTGNPGEFDITFIATQNLDFEVQGSSDLKSGFTRIGEPFKGTGDEQTVTVTATPASAAKYFWRITSSEIE
jgi:hypothetical protein